MKPKTIKQLIKQEKQKKKYNYDIKSFSIKNDIIEELKQLKKETGLSASEVVNLALSRVIQEYKEIDK